MPPGLLAAPPALPSRALEIIFPTKLCFSNFHNISTLQHKKIQKFCLRTEFLLEIGSNFVQKARQKQKSLP